MSDLASLIARLEAAEGPSRELDCAIFLATRDPRLDKRWGPYHGLRAKGSPDDPTGFAERFAPRYSASLDSAILLVPEGWSWHAGTDWDDAGTVHGIASVEERAEFRDDPELRHPGHYTGRRQEAEAATPALALCLAALKLEADGLVRVNR